MKKSVDSIEDWIFVQWSNWESAIFTGFSTLLVTDEYQQMQYDQLKQHHATKKRALNQIQDNAGPTPKSTRRRQ